MSDFQVALAHTLQAETSYKQPVGGPYIRNRHGAILDPETGKLKTPDGELHDIPTRPDGLAFDNDPDDSGGRTGMGILQREYNAWRTARNLPHRDVWIILDSELEAIYRVQYWDELKCDKLPTGVNFVTFDSGVNCGVGMGAKFLQRALNIRDDGHLGVSTMQALEGVDPHELIKNEIAAREAYHRACKTFWKFGKGWLERDDVTEHQACDMLDVESTLTPNYLMAAQDSRKALPPDNPDSVAETATGQSASVKGAIGGGFTLREAYGLYQQSQDTGLIHVLTDPKNLMPLAVIVAGLTIIAYSRRDWIDRARKLLGA